ncbi:cation:proton antiporter regulatory subunit [Pseudomonas putida]|uniref:cation:proton antiporter regulatory subunit n=1 Tax=Pseudomonas putida TaxID=303 RepID=UPI0021B0E5F7
MLTSTHPAELGEVLGKLDLLLEAEREAREAEQQNDKNSDTEKKVSNDEDRAMQELLVKPDSSLIGRSASSTRLRSRYSINLLAISRQSHRSIKRLRATQIQGGDVLLMQGSAEDIGEFASDYDSRHTNYIGTSYKNLNSPAKFHCLATLHYLIPAAGYTLTLGTLNNPKTCRMVGLIAHAMPTFVCKFS